MRRLAALLILAMSCSLVAPQILYLETSQGRIHVDDGGEGTGLPVLFVHGNGGNLTQWKAQLDYFRKTRRAIAIDLRGMGVSDAPGNGDYSIEAMADDINDVVNALRLDRVVIVGHSFGGAVVARFAEKYPDRVAGVVYADSAGDINATEDAKERFLTAVRLDKKAVVEKWFEPILTNASPAVKSAVLASVDATSVEAFTGALEALGKFKVAEAVRAYAGPKLAIVGDHNNLPDLPVRKMSGVSHWLMMDRPQEFNRLVALFIADVEKR